MSNTPVAIDAVKQEIALLQVERDMLLVELETIMDEHSHDYTDYVCDLITKIKEDLK